MSLSAFFLAKRRVVALLLLAVLALAVYAERGRILRAVGEYLVVNTPIEKADAIVVLSGSLPERILEGAELYKEGYANLILLTRVPLPIAYRKLVEKGIKIPLNYELNFEIAVASGVKKDDIVVLKPFVDSTRSESLAVKDFILKNGLDSIIIVTSPTHTRRAYTIFRDTIERCVPRKVKVMVRATRYDPFKPAIWWKIKGHIDQVVLEYEKLAYYYLFEDKGC